MGHITNLLILLISLSISQNINADNHLLPKDFQELSSLFENTLNKSKARQYSEMTIQLEAWLKKYPNSSYKEFISQQITRLKKAEGIFKKLKQCPAQTLIGTALKIGKTKATVSDYKNGTLTLKLVLSGSATKKEILNLEKLPALSIYYLLIKAHPKTQLEDTATLLLADQNYKLAKSILGKMHKGGKDISWHSAWFKEWYSYPQFAAFYKSFKEVASMVEAGSYGNASTQIGTLKKSTAKNETLNVLFNNLIENSSKVISEAEEKAREEELAAYIKYPVKAGQHTKVTCKDFPNIKYDIYLPPQYDHKGKVFLPIMYTFSPGGGGMVRHFKKIAEEMGVIIVGSLESKNGVNSDVYRGTLYATTADIRSRVHFDPTAQFSAGMSGGGWTAYGFARLNAPHTSGVLAMGAWLGNQHDHDFDWHKEGLLVARTHGNKDGGAKGYLGKDAAYLNDYKITKIKDWEFPGGHVSAPLEIQRPALKWMLENRKTQSSADIKNAQELSQKIQGYIASGNTQQAFDMSMKTMMTMPRTWHAYMAQKAIDKLMNLPAASLKGTFKNVNDLPGKYELLDFLSFQLEGAGLIGQENVVHNSFECLKNLKSGLKRWYLTPVWFLAAAKFENVRKPNVVIDLLGKKKSLKINEQICLGAAYAHKGDMEKAKEIMAKIQKQVKNKASHNSSYLAAFKKLLD